MSIEKPPDNPINTRPTANPNDNKTATEESEYTLLLEFNFTIANPPKTETTNETQIGLLFRNSPKAIPPKATWDIASPNKENLLSTKNSPSREQLRDIAIPEISALWINSYCKISSKPDSLLF
jgi:hypothetical protein